MYVPPEWHAAAAHIVPVRKKGITGDFSNYRPISLTCVTSKILERIIVNRIFDHLAHNSILHPSQHGFVKQRSTCTNHLESFNDWTLNEATHFHCVCRFYHFSKAFDVVSHNKLFARLYSYGIRGSGYYCENYYAIIMHIMDVRIRQELVLLCLMLRIY